MLLERFGTKFMHNAVNYVDFSTKSFKVIAGCAETIYAPEAATGSSVIWLGLESETGNKKSRGFALVLFVDWCTPKL